MNLLLLPRGSIDADGLAQVQGEAVVHVRRVLGKGVGDTLKIGEREGEVGTAVIEALDDDGLRLRCSLDGAPPPKLLVTVVLALPRPPVLRRVLQHATTMGVARIVLCNAARVEKSYWSSPALSPEEIDAQLRLGLEQARDTVTPVVEQRPRLRPFVQDELAHDAVTRRWLADGEGRTPLPCDVREPSIVAIGPEGGWVDFERGLFADAGFTAVTLGARPLRVETAVVAALARISV